MDRCEMFGALKIRLTTKWKHAYCELAQSSAVLKYNLTELQVSDNRCSEKVWSLIKPVAVLLEIGHTYSINQKFGHTFPFSWMRERI